MIKLYIQFFGGRGSSGSRGGGGKVSSDIQKKIDALQPLEGDQFKNPLPFVGWETSSKIQRMIGDLPADERGEIRLVDASKVMSAQDFIYKGPLENPKTSNSPIQAAEYNGKIIIIDGNHRALMAKWKNEKIKVEVYKV